MSEKLRELVAKYKKWRESVASCAGYEGSNAGDIASASDYLTYGTIIEDLEKLVALAEKPAEPPAVICKVCEAPFEVADGEHVCGLTATEAYSLGWRRGNNITSRAAHPQLSEEQVSPSAEPWIACAEPLDSHGKWICLRRKGHKGKHSPKSEYKPAPATPAAEGAPEHDADCPARKFGLLSSCNCDHGDVPISHAPAAQPVKSSEQ
jgi:hypothetical protein